MSRPPERPFRAALAAALLCAAAILGAQVVATVVPAVGAGLRGMPLIPVGLAIATALVVIQIIRAR